MKIALVSTCALATPPHKYGGTELVVAQLAQGLLELGHHVTTFATGDSHVPGRLRYHFANPVWPPDELAESRHAGHAWHEIASAPQDYDAVHLHHAGGLAYQLFVPIPSVMTIHHCRVDALIDHYRAFPQVAYVAISARQAALSPELPVRRVIHHGLDPTRYPVGAGSGGYVAFLGRFSEEKAPHLAIDAARAAGVPLRLGGTYHHVAVDYYRRELAPRLARPGAQLCGELGHEDKVELLRGASAMLFPIQWEEPFGLVMIEAMLVGTPVIAFRRGSAPEVIEDGVTGFLVDSTEEMAQRISELSHFDRMRCSERARERWSAQRMALEYAELYEELARGQQRLSTRIKPAALRPVAGAGVAANVMIEQDPPSHSAPRLTKELDHAATIRAERG